MGGHPIELLDRNGDLTMMTDGRPSNLDGQGHYGLPIWTGDEIQPEAEAIAIAGDTILAIGKGSDVSALRGPQTEMIDASRPVLM